MWAWYPTVFMDVIRTFTFDGENTMFKKTDLFQGQVPDYVMGAGGGITGRPCLQWKS